MAARSAERARTGGVDPIEDGPKFYDPGAGTRDRVIAAIYESVIRPELYGAFMEAWGAHIQAVMHEQPEALAAAGGGADGLTIDPELEAHFGRAYEILQQMGRQSPVPSLSEQIAASPGFAVILDTRGQAIAMSPAARKRLGAEASALEALRGSLTAGSADLLGQLLEGADPQSAPVVLSTGWRPRHLMARTVEGPAIVIEALEYSWSAAAEAMLVASFGLSRAEVEIVRHLLAGFSLKQIAAETGRSEHTVRNQSKAVLAKTGAPGQVDLIRLVVFLINQESRKAARRSGTLSLEREMVELDGGRRVQIYRAGAEGGRPVLFLHGMLEGPAVLEFLAPHLHARGLSVLMPARPGFGQTDPVARAPQALDVMESITRQVIARDALRRPVLLGHMGGSMYGHVLARRLGQQVAGLVCVSGVAPIERLGQLANMAPRQRVVAYTARFAPALLPTILRAGIAQIDGKGVEDFMAALYAQGTHDREAIERLGIGALLQSGYRFSVEQGDIGFATDSHFVVRDWSAEIEGLTVPVHYFNGRHDPVVPANRVVRAMQDRAHVQVTVREDAGQLLFYEYPDMVLDAVERLAGNGG